MSNESAELSAAQYLSGDRLGAYPGEVHRELNPTWLTTLLAFEGVVPPRMQGARLLDIGCGAGLDVIALACANPDMELTGVDPDGAQIARAEALAARLGLRNTRFLHGGFDDPRIGTGYDYVSANGLYSWLPEERRTALCHAFAAAVAPGGVGVLHYLVSPGATLWSSLRAVLAGLEMQMPLAAALARMRAMAEDGYGIFATLPGAGAVLAQISAWPEEALRHDLLNSHYAPEVAPRLIARLSGLGLDFVASADPLANHDVFALPGGLPPEAPPSRSHRALLSDIATGRLSRTDMFLRAPRLIAPAQQAQLLDGLHIALMPGRAQVQSFEVPTAFGPITPERTMVLQVLGLLRQRPAPLRSLASLPAINGDLATLFQLLGAMMAVDLVHPLRSLRQDAGFVQGFNALAVTEALGARLPGALSLATGGLIRAGVGAAPIAGAQIAAQIAADRQGFFR